MESKLVETQQSYYSHAMKDHDVIADACRPKEQPKETAEEQSTGPSSPPPPAPGAQPATGDEQMDATAASSSHIDKSGKLTDTSVPHDKKDSSMEQSQPAAITETTSSDPLEDKYVKIA